MGNAIRKIVAGTRKAPKSVLVVTNTARMRPRMEEIRALGYECTLTEAGGGAMNFLRDGERVNVVVLDLRSPESAGKMIWWIRKNRPGVRVVCILNADLADFGPKAVALGADKVLDENEIDQVPEVLLSLLGEQTR